MRTIFELFARSPFEPLLRHAQMVHQVVDQVRPLIDAFLAEKWRDAEEVYQRISRLEHKADEIKQEIRDHLPRSLFLPVDRGDLLRYLKEQDAIADAVEDLAVLVSMRETPCPPGMEPSVRELVDQVLTATDTWFEVATALPELREASFTGPEVRRVQDLIQTLSTQEWEADKAQWALSRSMVEHEEALGPVSFLFWMRIATRLGAIANHSENTADLLRLMLAKS